MQMHTGRTLAFLGDAVWSLKVREYFVDKGYEKGKDLQKLSTDFVSAKAQAFFYDYLHNEGLLTEEEEKYFKRGRMPMRVLFLIILQFKFIERVQVLKQFWVIFI